MSISILSYHQAANQGTFNLTLFYRPNPKQWQNRMPNLRSRSCSIHDAAVSFHQIHITYLVWLPLHC